MLHKHQVGFFSAFGQPCVKAAGEDHVGAFVVLRKRRIGNYPIERAQFAVFSVLGLGERVFVLNIGTAGIVLDHVHFADGPGAVVALLAKQVNIARVAAAFFHILFALDQHTAGATGRIVDFVAFGGLDQLY